MSAPDPSEHVQELVFSYLERTSAGESAASVLGELLERIAQPERSPRQITLRSEIVLRRSTAATVRPTPRRSLTCNLARSMPWYTATC